MKTIYINTSDIPAFIGQNKWDIITPFERLWSKCEDAVFIKNLQKKDKDLFTTDNTRVARIISQETLTDITSSSKVPSVQKVQLVKALEEKHSSSLLKITGNTVKKQSIIDNLQDITKQSIDSVKESRIKVLEDIKLLVDTTALQEIEKIQEKTSKQLERCNTPLKLEKIIETENNKIIKQIEKCIQATSKQEIKSLENLKIKKGDNVAEKVQVYQKDELTRFKKEVGSVVNKTFGTIQESPVLARLEELYNIKIDTSQKLIKKHFCTTDNIEWVICGRLDGIVCQDDSKYIIEVKNRVNCIFKNIRDYENTQMHIYMWIMNNNDINNNNNECLEKYSHVKLCQNYNTTLDCTDVPFDETYFKCISTNLASFLEKFTQFLADDKQKIAYSKMTTREKNKYLKTTFGLA